MTRELASIFAELGLSHYLDAFVDQGFDAWDTILDIQESDLDALGVKLGHRRKLQRRIANARGIAPSVSLASTVKPVSEESKQELLRRDSCRADGINEANGVAKRKYRRHPKSDENAPERPPSAYVLFSNKMREDLKSQNLTFTEIAKLVGENWQNLPPVEKESYESQANAAKEKYHRQLAEYKKTSEYRVYAQYLHEFKEKQAKQNRGHDASKRLKMEPTRLRHGSTSSGATPGGATSSGSRSGSSSERLRGSEPPPNRQERLNSAASVSGSQHSPTAMSHSTPIDDDARSPRAGRFEPGSPREAHHGHSRRQASWAKRSRTDSAHQHLPSLSDMLDDNQKGMDMSMTGGNPRTLSMAAPGQSRLPADGPNVLPRTRASLLHNQPSPNSTNGSRGSAACPGRPPGEGPLPIHALLTERAMTGTAESGRQPVPAVKAGADANGQRRPALGLVYGPRGYGFQSESSAFRNMKVEQSGEGDVLMTAADTTPSASGDNNKNGFDGMRALLRAGEIVGCRGRQ